jgi:Flp pilus assembly protein TadD
MASGGAPSAESLLQSARAAFRQGRHEEAIAFLERSLAQREDPGVLCDLAVVLAQAGRGEAAEATLRRALELREAYPEAHNNLGLLLGAAGRAVAAERAFRRALELRESYPEAHNNLGTLLARQGRVGEAQHALRRALELRESYPEAHNNLGVLLSRQGLAREAERSHRRALELWEAYPEAYNNLAVLLAARGSTVEAEAAYRRALELNPDHHSARWNLGLLQLSLGRYEEGWRNYETRLEPAWREGPYRQLALPWPRWRGEELAGKSLLLLAEQGYGDCLQFVRYAPLLQQRLRPGRLTVRCPAALAALFAAVAGVDAIEVQEERVAVGAHDFWCLLGSLPLLLGTTSLAAVPAALPYVFAPESRIEHWRARLPQGGLRVGLVWKASATQRNDPRSPGELAALAPLWQVPGVTFVSLQKGAGEEEAAAGAPGCPLLHIGTELGDFADTAAALAQLDLLITVDTAFAHLNAALGRPTWILLAAHGADWRWLREREDSPWYPQVVRLFRQSEPGNWQPVIARLTRALTARARDSAEIGTGGPGDQRLARTGEDGSHPVQEE